MAKGKKTNNDMKVVAVVLGVFAAAVISFLVFSKAKEGQEQKIPDRTAETPVFKEPGPQAPAVRRPLLHPSAFTAVHGSGGKIAIIIDDWGQTTANCKYLKEIREPLAVSILPGLRHTRDVAECAGLYHKLAMLHLPLEAVHNSDYYPPDYIIKTNMDSALVSKIVEEDLEQLPSIEGVNNHMGSKATANRRLMELIFKRIKNRGLFFVDSLTASNSICAPLANEMGLAFGKRDVFLDNINTREAITRQFEVLAQKARRRGYAVAIGHDRRLTMQVIKDEIPWLEARGLRIVSIKELLVNK